MLLKQTVDRQAQPGVVPHHALERRVFAWMVKAVGLLFEVRNDVEHEAEQGAAVGLELRQLLFQDLEESGEPGMLGMPQCDQIGHVEPSRKPAGIRPVYAVLRLSLRSASRQTLVGSSACHAFLPQCGCGGNCR